MNRGKIKQKSSLEVLSILLFWTDSCEQINGACLLQARRCLKSIQTKEQATAHNGSKWLKPAKNK